MAIAIAGSFEERVAGSKISTVLPMRFHFKVLPVSNNLIVEPLPGRFTWRVIDLGICKSSTKLVD